MLSIVCAKLIAHCMCVCTRTRVRVRAHVRMCGTCNCKRNKATLSWLRLVCCRHEVPVTSEPITVIHMDEDVVVVNKPASIPVSGVLPELYCQKNRYRLSAYQDASTHASRCRTPDHARTRVPLHERDSPPSSLPEAPREPPRGGIDICRTRSSIALAIYPPPPSSDSVFTFDIHQETPKETSHAPVRVASSLSPFLCSC